MLQGCSIALVSCSVNYIAEDLVVCFSSIPLPWLQIISHQDLRSLESSRKNRSTGIVLHDAHWHLGFWGESKNTLIKNVAQKSIGVIVVAWIPAKICSFICSFMVSAQFLWQYDTLTNEVTAFPFGDYTGNEFWVDNNSCLNTLAMSEMSRMGLRIWS